MLSTILVGLAVATTDVMDVQHYRLDLHVDPTSKSLRGDVEIRAQVVSAAAAELTLHLSQALVVDGVKVNGKPARFTHENDRLRRM
jgi:aminopeptidase N